jgi:hypothetical protein
VLDRTREIGARRTAVNAVPLIGQFQGIQFPNVLFIVNHQYFCHEILL